MRKEITTLVINLTKDVDRFNHISAALAADEKVEMIRISALAGRDLPHVGRSALAYNNGWAFKPGELGCFLSHVKAWEFTAAFSGPFCVILEDDGVPSGIGRLTSATLPDEFDLIFVNDRMTGGSRSDPPTLPISFIPVRESLPRLNEHSGGVGGDGYILTPAGAKKLLDAVSNDLFFGHVDWRILRYCLVPSDLGGILADTFVASVINNHHNPYRTPAWGVLRAYCASTPLIHAGVLPSSRDLMNKSAES